MTIRINDADLGNLVELAAWSGSILILLLAGLVLYLMVRPPRRARAEKEEPAVAEEMLQLMERMEQRLETLERAVREDGAERNRPQNSGQGPVLRRIK